MSKERPTMKDVAARAGVTQPTVSYVINGTAKVTDEVRDKVLNAIEELNYKPNYYARALKTNKINIVGIVIPDIVNQYYSSLVNMVEDALAKEHHRVIISCTNYKKSTEEAAIRHMLEYNVTGIIVMYQMVSERAWSLLGKARCEVVALEMGTEHNEFMCVNTDGFYGSYTATEHLIRQGRKRIAYVGQGSHIEALVQRQKAYEKAMEDYGLAEYKNIYSTTSPGNKWNEGVKIGKQILQDQVEGLIVSSDIVAAGILKILLMNKVSVPQDIAVIGYDDIPLAELFTPSISTVHQPMEKMSENAVDMILGKDKRAKNIVLKPQLIERETT